MRVGDQAARRRLAGVSNDELDELVVRARTIHGVLRDRNVGTHDKQSRAGHIGSAELAGRFDPSDETVLHAAALLLGLDLTDAKWLHGGGIPTPLVERLHALAPRWLSDRSDSPDFLDRWESRLRLHFSTPPSLGNGGTARSRYARIVILTGAGISAESGISTFRDANGLWEQHQIEEVASMRGFEQDPDMVHRFYNSRRTQLEEVQPNPAHYALAALENVFPDEVLIVTQNVDDLHEAAGSHDVIHMHGRLRSELCMACGERDECWRDLSTDSACRHCGARALRPDVVWFGENVREGDRIYAALAHCEMLVVVGTSGTVYPAAAFAEYARAHGAETVVINLDDKTAFDFDHRYIGSASERVPVWVRDALLGFGAAGPETEHTKDPIQYDGDDLPRIIGDFVDGEVHQSMNDYGLYSPKGASALLDRLSVKRIDGHLAMGELERVIEELIGDVNSGEAGSEAFVAFSRAHAARAEPALAQLKIARLEHAADLIAWLVACSRKPAPGADRTERE